MPTNTPSPETIDTPVVIAGGGPVGLVLALELSHHGVRSLLVERRAATTTSPKMDITNARSMELLARLGLADVVRSVGVPSRHSFDVIFASSLAGRAYGRWQLPSADEMRTEIARCADGSMPAEAWLRASQADVEAALMARCLEDEMIDVQRAWQVPGAGTSRWRERSRWSPAAPCGPANTPTASHPDCEDS
jgi:FAD-dependent monooxygenase